MRQYKYIIVSAIAIIYCGCSVEQPEVQYAETEETLMQEFFIAKVDNPQLGSDIRFEYDSANHTFTYITSKLIGGIDSLRPTFIANGDAYIDNVEQQTGLTPCDFSQRQILYTVRNKETLTQQTCTVSIVSPQTTGLPVLCIDIDEGKTVQDRETYLPASFSLYDTHSIIQGRAEIKGRGNSTWWQDKKPYKIRLAEKTSLCGMHKAKTWVLLANALDPTLMDNTVGLEMARRAGLEFTNHAQPVELYINNQHRGNYVLTEQIQVRKGRVEVDTLNGGFLVEIDGNYDKEFKQHTRYFNLPVMMRAPKNSQALQEAVGAIETIEQVLKNPNFNIDVMSSLTDIESLARYILIMEIIRNGEVGHPKSVFCYRKDRNSPICWGPAWDFDWGFGYMGREYRYFRYSDMLMFDFRNNRYLGGSGGNFFAAFLKNKQFQQRYIEEWNDIYPELQGIENYVFDEAEQIAYSWQLNKDVWHLDIKPQSNLAAGMAGWLMLRLDYMNNYYNQQ